jgi:cation transport protein ChaC
MSRMTDLAHSQEPPWIFGYGSLMWRPGFPFRARAKARLPGFERAFCRYSFRHRGTPERPGLVIGLREIEDPGEPGAARGRAARGCVGIAFLPEPDSLAETMAYLEEREGAGYRRVLRPITLLDGPPAEKSAPRDQHSAATVPAWVYIPNPEHPSYFGQKDLAQIVPLILQGRGESGTAYDYLAAMLGELHKIGVAEPALEAVLRAVEARRAERDAATSS